MDPSGFNGFDIFEIYKRYHEITSASYGSVVEGGATAEESEKVKLSRDALSQLLKEVELSVHMRGSIFDEVLKLMSRLDLTVDFSEFSHLYNFVFFICRENGQKNITVSRAIMAWRLVLAGRFRLLNQWCDFVEENQRHNISEDTWRQVLAFSRCVHENLEGYDPEGAWPVVVDEFVEHMYRITGTNNNPNVLCNCGDSVPQLFEDPLPGLKTFPGLKRKLNEDCERQELQFMCSHSGYKFPRGCKRNQIFASEGKLKLNNNPPGNGTDHCMGIVKHNVQLGCSKSHCAVEGCLSKGFAGLFSGRSCLQFDRKRRVSFT